MDSKKRVRDALVHRQPDRVPVDFGGTAVTGMHVTCVTALRDLVNLPDEANPTDAANPPDTVNPSDTVNLPDTVNSSDEVSPPYADGNIAEESNNPAVDAGLQQPDVMPQTGRYRYGQVAGDRQIYCKI